MNRLGFLFVSLFLFSCQPKVEVYAPEQEIYAVWGVLNPVKEVQYIKIEKLFRTESDALLYPQNVDLSVTNLQVEIKGDGKVWLGELETLERDDGIFYGQHTLYKFNTSGSNRLVEGKEYELNIRKEEDPDFIITARTLIPGVAEIVQPYGPVYVLQTEHWSFPTVDFRDDYVTYFEAKWTKGAEARVWVDYEVDGIPKTTLWGPSRINLEPTGCNANQERNEFCILIPAKSVGRRLQSVFEAEVGGVSYHDSIRSSPDFNALSRTARFEITTVDSFLTTYLYTNIPFGFGLNLLMDKPDLTNLSGENIGVFGSINTSFHYVNLGVCTKYQAGLIPSAPSFCN